MNNYQKMRETNKKVRRKLEELGFSDIIMFGHSRFRHDIYGWDGVCKKMIKSELLRVYSEMFDIYWIQIKTGYVSGNERKTLTEFCKKSGENGLIVELVPYKEKYKNQKCSYTKHKIIVTEMEGV